MSFSSQIMAGGLSAESAKAIVGSITKTAIAAGTNQATALRLGTVVNFITTVAAGTGVMLPTMNDADLCVIFNQGANALLVYPPVGFSIDSQSVNASISVPVSTSVFIYGSGNNNYTSKNDLATLGLSTSSGLVGFSHANTYAQGTVGQVLNNVIHIKDAPYNAVCDGVTDDTTAILACIAANPGRTIRFSGTPRIKSKLTQGLHQKWIGDGGRGTTAADLPACYLIKDSSFTGDFAVSIGSPAGMVGIGLVLENGSTGGGVQVEGHASGCGESQIVGQGVAGSNGPAWRYGNTIGSNTNCWWNYRCLAYGAGIEDGLIAHDGSGGAPNVNAGKVTLFEAQLCHRDGTRNENANGNIYEVGNCETVVGYALHIVDGDDCILLGGDYEASTAGQIQIESAAARTIVLTGPGFTLVDNSTTTVLLNNLIQKQTTWTPALAGASTAGTQTYGSQVGTYQRFGPMVYVTWRVTLTAKDGTTAGAMRITGLPFTYPSGLANAVAGCGIGQWGNITFPANFTQLCGEVLPNTSYVTLTRAGSGQTAAFVDAAEIGATSQVFGSAWYPIVTL